MELEKLCDLYLEYDDDNPVVVIPYGGREGQGFGTGTGRAEGALKGTVRWANSPRLREDGIFLPDTRGSILTVDGPIIWRADGVSLPPDQHGRRLLVGQIRFLTELSAHRWLNDTVAVHDGALDLSSGVVHLPVYACRPGRARPG